MRSKPLDARTLRAVVRSERARMRRNARYWPNDEWLYAEAMLKRMLDKAGRCEVGVKARKPAPLPARKTRKKP